MATRNIEPYRDPRLPDRFTRWIEVLRKRIRTIPCYTEGDGSPEGIVAGIAGDRYYDLTNFALYIKSTNTGLTGWLEVGGGGGAGTGGIPSRRNLIVAAPLRSDGADVSINFTAADWDPTNLRVLVGGNNSFVGSMDAVLKGKIVQPSSLPSSVITNGNISDIRLNNTDGGVLVRITNNFARAATAMSAWIDITTTLSARTYAGIESWKTTQLVCLHSRLSGPLRDYIVSTDNGVPANWTEHYSGLLTGGRQGIRKSQGDLKLGFIGSTATFVWTASTSLTAGTIWNVFDFGALFSAVGNGSDMDWNEDASAAIYCTTSGDVVVSTDGGTTWSLFSRDDNVFRNSTTGFTAIDVCVFVNDLDGWLILGSSFGAFISDDGLLDTMTVVSYAMFASVAITDRSRATDGTEMIVPVSTNNSIMLLQQS